MSVDDCSRFIEETIPRPDESRKHRTLVLCFDGTHDEFDEDNSNVVNFFRMLRKDSPEDQMVYYQAGIGTYTLPHIRGSLREKWYKIQDAMLGVHLDSHVMGGYKFLMQNYRIGDRISLFGFSRGAYTVRVLASMLFKIGLLAKDNQEQIAFAYRMFSRGDWEGIIQCREFKKTFSIDVHVDFIGLWDTVGSIGFIRGDFTTLSTHVRCVRHALALDERRVRFEPTFFTLPTREELMMGLNWGEKSHPSKPKKKKGETTQTRDEDKDYDPTKFDLEEVWFAGCHAGMKNLNDRSEIRLTMFHLSCNPGPDVGGGSVTNNTRNSLSRIPLRWMVRECFKAKTGILFYKDSFKSVGLDYNMLWPEVKERPPPVLEFSGAKPTQNSSYEWVYPDNSDFVNEEEEDLADALSPKNDMLSLANSRFWWILEFIPHRIRCPGTADVVEDFWTRKLSINRKRGRFIPQQIQHGVKIHRTVKIR